MIDLFGNETAIALSEKAVSLRELTPKQEIFAKAFVRLGFIAQAEKEAGLSVGYGQDLLDLPHVQARVEVLRSRALDQHDDTMERIVERLELIENLDPAEAYEMALAVRSVIIRHDSSKGDDGISIQEVKAQLNKIPIEIRRLLEVSFTAKGININWPNKLKSREQLIRIKGGFAPEKHDFNVPLINVVNIHRTS